MKKTTRIKNYHTVSPSRGTLKLNGLSANYGNAKGRVVFIKTIDDIRNVQKDDIVITDKITSEYTEAFMKAGAVISARGGITCHAAIVCREQGKPCIVACTDAFTLFTEGMKIEIDTKNLTYTIIS